MAVVGSPTFPEVICWSCTVPQEVILLGDRTSCRLSVTESLQRGGLRHRLGYGSMLHGHGNEHRGQLLPNPRRSLPSQHCFRRLDLWDDDVCCLKSHFVTVTLTKLQWWLCRETMALFWVKHDRKGSRICGKMRYIYLILMCVGLIVRVPQETFHGETVNSPLIRFHCVQV